jgi:hypothetical protein
MAKGGGILGNVKPFTVNFVFGISSPEYIKISLDNNNIHDSFVNVEDIEWQWLCRCSRDKKWARMNKTRHRIYTVLKEPVLPWKQSPYPETQNPWGDVLDYSCKWAAETKSLDEAAAAVTLRVNLPEAGLEYDVFSGNCHYSGCVPGDSFDCTAYIDRLAGGWGNGRLANCSDCACMVATFSNIF